MSVGRPAFPFFFMPIVFYILYALFGLSEIGISRLLRSNAAEQKADQNSLLLLWVVIVASLTAAVWVSFTVYQPIDAAGRVPYIGLVLMGIGMALRWMVIRALGRLFTADVAIRENHALKTDGLYRWVRHPSYAALALVFLGFGLSLNNWISLVLVMVPVVPALLYRIRVEEAALTAHFGAAYEAYKARTKALIPGVI